MSRALCAPLLLFALLGLIPPHAGATEQSVSSTRMNDAPRTPSDTPGELSGRRTQAIKGLAYSGAALLLLFSLLRGIRQRRTTSSPQSIAVLARRFLSSECALVIAQVEGRRLLLSQTPSRIELLTELDENTEKASDAVVEEKPTVPKLLRGALRQKV